MLKSNIRTMDDLQFNLSGRMPPQQNQSKGIELLDIRTQGTLTQSVTIKSKNGGRPAHVMREAKPLPAMVETTN